MHIEIVFAASSVRKIYENILRRGGAVVEVGSEIHRKSGLGFEVFPSVLVKNIRGGS